MNFNCTECGQPIAAKPEYYGQTVNCPTCNTELVVPTPPASTSPERTVSPELAALIERAAGMRLTYNRPADIEDDEQEEISRLDEFFYESDSLEGMVGNMKLLDEIRRKPNPLEMIAMRAALFSEVVSGNWGGTEEDLKELIFQHAPDIRA